MKRKKSRNIALRRLYINMFQFNNMEKTLINDVSRFRYLGIIKGNKSADHKCNI